MASSSRASELAPVEFARWCWRQLTSMRTALLLLLILAIASIPGSVFPQDDVDSVAAARWREDHETWAPILERLGFFSVYDSVWFAAIYLLLMVSLVGCIVPRTRHYFGRIIGRSGKMAWRDRIHESGNLLFHLSILVVLAGVAWGSLTGYRGGVLVVEGSGFANKLTQYDDFDPGALFDAGDLEPFSFTVDNFDITFLTEGRQAGAAKNFAAALSIQTSVDGEVDEQVVRVNHPVDVNGTEIFLIGHGYAPHLTFRDATGQVALAGPVVFLPEDPSFRSFGVLKIPDAATPDGPVQIGFEGEFYPTYAFTPDSGPFSAFPDDKNPALSMLGYIGDLGLDDGKPQSVYLLDKTNLEPIMDGDKPFRLDIGLGQRVVLPDGLGTVEFDGMSRFVKLQVSTSPGEAIALGGVLVALVGLLASLFVRPTAAAVRRRRSEEEQ